MSHNITLNRKEIEFITTHLMGEQFPTEREKIVKKLEKCLNPIKISSRKQKGRNLQKWVCEQIAKLFNIEYDQQDDNCPIHSREMGQSGVDVIIRGELQQRFPFAIECKSSEQLNLPQTIKQTKKNAKGKYWIIVHKRKAFKKPVVIMDWDCFYGLCVDFLWRWNRENH